MQHGWVQALPVLASWAARALAIASKLAGPLKAKALAAKLAGPLRAKALAA